jgi:ankyrin repeat protein
MAAAAAAAAASTEEDIALVDTINEFLVDESNDNTKAVLKLIRSVKNINTRGDDGMTPLQVAALVGNDKVVEALLKIDGIDVNAKDNDIRDAPIHQAIRAGKIECVKLLLAREEINVNIKNDDDTPLYVAIYKSNEPIALELLKREDVDVNIPNYVGETPLYEACRRKLFQIVKPLIEKGADVNAKTKNSKNTPLHAAASEGAATIVETLLQHHADVNSQNKWGTTPLFFATTYYHLATARVLLEGGADLNIATNGKETPLSHICESSKLGYPILESFVKLFLDNPRLDKSAEVNKKLLSKAKQGLFTGKLNTLLISALGAASAHGAEKWKGWTRSDAVAMDAIFGAIEPHKNFPNNERYTFVPLDDITYCPICLAYTPRVGAAGETKGCMYMYHDCTKTAGVVYHEELYEKYKSDDGLIWWCTICNRIAKGHQHYALGPPDVEGDTPRVLKATGSPFDKSCKPGHGGGGIEEKVRRFMRLREVAKELNERAGEITRQEAANTLVEEMWLAGLAERRDAKRVAAALEAKAFPNKAENFPANRANAAGPPNRNYPNVTRSAANVAELKPIISRDTEKWDSVDLDYLKPAILFHHRDTTGKVVRHTPGKENGDDGEWLGFKTVRERIEYSVKNFGAEDFGACPIAGCKARLYPDEIQQAVSKELYEDYRKAFNKRFAEGVKGGGKKRFTRRQRKQKGGAYQGLFHKLEDAKCVRPWKTGR